MFKSLSSPIIALIVSFLMVNYTYAQEKSTILVLGDSLSAAYGMPVEQGWVNLLAITLKQQGNKINLINASITGDTSDGGARRLPTLLQKHAPDIVIIELGGNDGLRGFDLSHTERQLAAMVEQVQKAGVEPLLVEIMLPPNYGKRYTQAFQNIYSRIAERYQITLIPSFLPAIASDPKLMQADGVHPAASAQPQISQHILPYINQALAH
jgi:acyl-CoA thioesterase-1